MDEFTTAYVDCAIWSSNVGDDDGTPLDDDHDATDLAPETWVKMKADCAKFQKENAEALGSAIHIRFHNQKNNRQAGHDFWLTRNGHGCGFWDGDWSEPEASKLDSASKAFGECDLYVGDDGKIYAL